MTCRFCPNCGHDIERFDRTLSIGRLTIDSGYILVDGEKLIHLTPQQSEILRMLALAHPRTVRLDAIILRLGTQEGEDCEGTVRVQISRMRRVLERSGLPSTTIRTDWGRGYALHTEQVAA